MSNKLHLKKKTKKKNEKKVEMFNLMFIKDIYYYYTKNFSLFFCLFWSWSIMLIQKKKNYE